MYRISALSATSSIHPALYAISVRTVGISPRTSSSTVCYLPAVVLQVWDSASSRLRADFHRSAHIASVVQSSRGTFVPLSHHRTCHLWHTAVSRRVIGPGTNVPAATLLSLLAGYPVNSSALLRGFGLAPLSIFQSRLRTFQYFLALLL